MSSSDEPDVIELVHSALINFNTLFSKFPVMPPMAEVVKVQLEEALRLMGREP